MEPVGTKGLAILVLVLAGALALAWSNPTAAEYERYQDRLLEETLARLASSQRVASRGVLQQLINSKNSLFLKSLVRSQTTRLDLWLCSLYETKLLSARLIVLGIGGTFVPLTDPEKTLQELERTAIAPSK